MSPRDDEVWRQVVDDARIRSHELRACEGGPHAGIGRDAIDRIATRATHPGAIPRARSQTIRFAALAVAVIGLASTVAWVTTPIFFPKQATLATHTFLDAMSQVVDAADPSERFGCANVLKDGCIRTWHALQELSQHPHPAIAATSSEQLQVLALAIRGVFPRVMSFTVAEVDTEIAAARLSTEPTEGVAHIEAAGKAAVAGVFRITRHAIDSECDQTERRRPLSRLRRLLPE